LEFFIDNEAGKDGISSHTINTHEAGSNDVSEDENAENWEEGGVQAVIEPINLGNNKEAGKGSNRSNEHFSEEDKNASNTSHNTESEGISEDKEESILGSEAEVFTSQGNLNISILVQELNESFKASNITL